MSGATYTTAEAIYMTNNATRTTSEVIYTTSEGTRTTSEAARTTSEVARAMCKAICKQVKIKNNYVIDRNCRNLSPRF